MSVEDRNTYTLACDDRCGSRNDHAVLHFTPKTQRLLFALLFLAADIRDDISHHLRPICKGLARAGNRLIGRSNHFIGLKLFPCSQDRRIALNRAVGFYSNEASLGTESFFLRFDNCRMLRIDLRNHHRDIRCPAVCGVIGNNRCFCLCIGFLDLFDLVLCHIDSAEYKINLGCYMLHIVNV